MTVKTFAVFSQNLKEIEVANKAEGIAVAMAELKHGATRSASIVVCGCDVIWGAYKDATGIVVNDYR